MGRHLRHAKDVKRLDVVVLPYATGQPALLESGPLAGLLANHESNSLVQHVVPLVDLALESDAPVVRRLHIRQQLLVRSVELPQKMNLHLSSGYYQEGLLGKQPSWIEKRS